MLPPLAGRWLFSVTVLTDFPSPGRLLSAVPITLLKYGLGLILKIPTDSLRFLVDSFVKSKRGLGTCNLKDSR